VALLIVSAASVAVWLYLLFGRGAFWRMRAAPPEGSLPIPPPSVVAVIPARNEAPVVGQAVASLAAQRYPAAFHIVLADDDRRGPLLRNSAIPPCCWGPRRFRWC
jgi:cellulose synthase/poly-beta-1,6-N-acetylglucosamine synthase-like glycosyltransferase